MVVLWEGLAALKGNICLFLKHLVSHVSSTQILITLQCLWCELETTRRPIKPNHLSDCPGVIQVDVMQVDSLVLVEILIVFIHEKTLCLRKGQKVSFLKSCLFCWERQFFFNQLHFSHVCLKLRWRLVCMLWRQHHYCISPLILWKPNTGLSLLSSPSISE